MGLWSHWLLTDYNNALCTLLNLQIIFPGSCERSTSSQLCGIYSSPNKKQVSKQPRYNEGVIPHMKTYLWVWVLCAEPRSPLAFLSGSWAGAIQKSPIFSPFFLVRTTMDPTKLAICWALTRPWENNLQMRQSTQSITIISKKTAAPKTHIFRLSPTVLVRQ